MTDNEIIYFIKQNKKLTALWADLTLEQKRKLLEIMRDRTYLELDRTMREITSGQNLLF